MRPLLAAAAAIGLIVASQISTARGGDASASQPQPSKETPDVKAEASAFLASYQKAYAELDTRANLASWKAANSGKKDDFAAAAEANLALCRFHSDAAAYQRLEALLRHSRELPPLDARALQVAELIYRQNQLPADLLEQMVKLSSEIEQTFKTYRAEVDGKRLTNNDLLEVLRKENDSQRRKHAWEALKQVGGAVAAKLVALAELRNRAARTLGFDNYWQMQIRLQEHDPQQLLAIFDELERLTREPFAAMKARMDGELAARFGVAPEDIMPWHYDNPFFQDAPPSAKVDLDEFYRTKSKEQIVGIARTFYDGIGLPVEEVLKRSDLYDREGKDQHAFCTSMDRSGDVRVLCNVKPTAEWMDTVLHELGHSVYELGVDPRLPYNLRTATHPFTTEGVAMFFGALSGDPQWMITCAGADKARVDELAPAIAEQRRREQLIFARWTMVMLHFEKALYENPRQDLNKLWWDYVERFQMLKRPPGRNEPDWAAKPHFTIAPVYYHNYMLGELFAAQMRHAIARLEGRSGAAPELQYAGRRDVGDYFKEKVFRPGASLPWPELVRHATGEPLTARYFAAEVGGNP